MSVNNSPLSQSAIDFGVTYTRATVQPGKLHWRLVSVEGPLERGGNANIYVDVLNEHGQRLGGVPVRFFWNNGEWVSATELKPDEPDQGTNMNMSAGGNAYGAHVSNAGELSDVLWGMGMVAFEKHKSWRAVFQRTIATDTGAPEPLPTPPTSTVTYMRAEIEDVMRHLQLANEQLAKGLLP